MTTTSRDVSMLTVPGVDYSTTRKDYDGLKAAGVKFAMRYISHDAAKDLTAEEKDELHRRGIEVGVVFETVARRALAGEEAGVTDARFADARVKSLNLAGIPIYLAADWDVTPAQKPIVANYLRGAASVLGKERTGVYGGYWVVKYMAEQNICDWFWQTYAWSGGQIHERTHIHQYENNVTIAGMRVDRNRGHEAGFGTRGPGGPDPTPVEDTVTVTLARLDFRFAAQTSVRHPLVDNVQALLKALRDPALDPGDIDGVGGANTLRTVVAFQRSRGLTDDGIVGPKTWRALIMA